jgi:hypothetical protein
MCLASLVRHTLAEPQGIDQCSVFTLVWKDTTATQRWAELCTMDGNAAKKPTIITKHHHSFIIFGGNIFDFKHYRS